jgi:hypothetical protein
MGASADRTYVELDLEMRDGDLSGMNDSSDETSGPNPAYVQKGAQQAAERAARAARVAQALRANLLKRKHQARARDAGATPSHESSGDSEDQSSP